jgi:SAM-dependent methyltransferase
MPMEEEYSAHSNLELDAQSHRFTEWLYRQVSRELKGDVLEIGSGIGTYAEKIIRDKSHLSHVMLTDIAPSYIEALTKRFSFTSNNNVSVSKLDLNRTEDYEKIGYEKFDSILSLNVLEHVENDEFALQQLYRMLKEDGTMVLLVPCHKFLYNVLDKKAGHFRRYTRKELEYKVSKTPFTIQRIFYFNMLGIVGWYLNGGLAKNPQINSTAYRLFDCLVPLSEHAEKLIGQKIGLSIICYLRKEPQKRTFSR